jgi:hypothetical protein
MLQTATKGSGRDSMNQNRDKFGTNRIRFDVSALVKGLEHIQGLRNAVRRRIARQIERPTSDRVADIDGNSALKGSNAEPFMIAPQTLLLPVAWNVIPMYGIIPSPYRDQRLDPEGRIRGR